MNNINNINIHGLWIGNDLSPLEQMCIQSYLNNGHTFNLWSYNTINNAPIDTKLKDANEIIPFTEVFTYKYTNRFGHGKGSYAGFSDIFRYKLLYEYGGWWTDMDVTCLSPLKFEQEYVFRKNGQKGVVGNLMKCPSKSKLMEYCFNRAIKEMSKNNKEWLLPITILQDGIKLFELNSFQDEFTNEDSWPVISTLLITNKDIPTNWLAIHWMNEEWRRFNIPKDYFIHGSSIEQLLNSLKINHGLLNPIESKKLKWLLGKWNYRYINLKARLFWYYDLIYSKLQTKDITT